MYTLCVTNTALLENNLWSLNKFMYVWLGWEGPKGEDENEEEKEEKCDSIILLE